MNYPQGIVEAINDLAPDPTVTANEAEAVRIFDMASDIADVLEKALALADAVEVDGKTWSSQYRNLRTALEKVGA